MTHFLIKVASQPVFAWVPGWMEMAIVLVIFMVLFGNRLPGTMRSLGKSLVEFKKGMNETDDESPAGSDKLH
jgi:sec-independent protein translocase protein TatA